MRAASIIALCIGSAYAAGSNFQCIKAHDHFPGGNAAQGRSLVNAALLKGNPPTEDLSNYCGPVANTANGCCFDVNDKSDAAHQGDGPIPLYYPCYGSHGCRRENARCEPNTATGFARCD